MSSQRKHQTFKDFYPYYLRAHSRQITRSFHFIGTFFVIILLILTVMMGKWWLLLCIPVAGYGFAWAGHFFFEKSKAAVLQYPIYSLRSDFVMFWHILTFQLSEKMKDAQSQMKEHSLT